MIQLRTGSGSPIENPTAADISVALASMQSVGEVATLTDGDGSSLQATRVRDGKFRVEHSDKPADEVYTARTRALALRTILRLFSLFAEGSPDWRGVIQWRQRAKLLEEPEGRSHSDLIGCFAVVLLVQILIVVGVYHAWDSGSGVLVPIRALPLLALAALLTPLGLSEAAAIAVVVGLPFLVIDVLLWKFFRS